MDGIRGFDFSIRSLVGHATWGWTGDEGRHAGVVVPYGWLRRAAAIALASGAQRSVCASGCEGGVGIDARTIPKGGPPPRPPRQRLAKRKARKEQLVKFDLCPIPSECSTAQKVRKSDKSPARAPVGAASTEQNSLEPHPAARQGASRARNCAATSVFSFDGSTAVFFLARQKENGGGKPSIFIDTPGRSAGPRTGRRGRRPLRVQREKCSAAARRT